MVKYPKCALCPIESQSRACLDPDGSGPRDCPTLNKQKAVSLARLEYEDAKTREFARQAAIQEAECYWDRERGTYPIKPRLKETIEFSQRMGFTRLGIAFCAGLKQEARKLAEVLEGYGFEVASVICKVGCISKEHLGISDEEKVRRGTRENICNPISQAGVLNEVQTEFNIVLGLCVGHDSHFFENSDAPVTVLAAKDRVTGHNPIAALYTVDSYSKWIKGK